MARGVAWRGALVAFLVTFAKYLGCAPASPSGPGPDTDGDGLTDAEELTIYGTSPLLADTDGDGYSDYQEVVTLAFDPANDPYLFNPRIADVAVMAVVFAGPPLVVVQTTDEQGVTHTITNSHSATVDTQVRNATTTTNGQSNTNEFSRTDLSSVAITEPIGGSGSSSSSSSSSSDASAEEEEEETEEAQDAGDGGDAANEAGRTDATVARDATTSSPGGPPPVDDDDSSSGASITLTNSVATTVSASTTFNTELSFTQEQIQENAETVSYEESYAQSHNITSVAGFLKLATVVQNRSRVAFRVTNLVLASAFVDGSGAEIPIGDLVIDLGLFNNFQPFSLGPGEQTGIVNFNTLALTLDQTFALLQNGHALDIRLSTYELSDAAGRPLAFNLAEVAAKTAVIVVDFGAASPPELFPVATNLDPAHPGVTAAKVFNEILQLPYDTDADGRLAAIRLPALDASTPGRWTVEWLHKKGAQVVTTPFGVSGEPYDFGSIELRAGDVLHIALVAPGAAPPPTQAGPPPLVTGPPMPDGGLKVTRP
jgi:hypothetical protein